MPPRAARHAAHAHRVLLATLLGAHRLEHRRRRVPRRAEGGAHGYGRLCARVRSGTPRAQPPRAHRSIRMRMRNDEDQPTGVFIHVCPGRASGNCAGAQAHEPDVRVMEWHGYKFIRCAPSARGFVAPCPRPHDTTRPAGPVVVLVASGLKPSSCTGTPYSESFPSYTLMTSL